MSMGEIAEERGPAASRSAYPGKAALAVAFVAVAWIALAAFWATPALFTVDGFVYRAMIDAFLRDGSLFVENGYAEYRAEPLVLRYLVASGDRLAPQYPGGWGILGAPFYLAGGVRGVMLLNAVASALTLAMVWIAAEALFRDHRLAATAALIYGLASFAVDYSVAFWPHAVTTFLVTASFAAVARGWRGGATDELRGAFLAGLAIGIAVNIRVDALLAAFGLAAWMTGAARRPFPGLTMLATGLLPGLAVATAINVIKFDRFTPVTYGGSKGASSLAHYAELLPIIAVATLACLALGFRRVRAVAFRPAVMAAGLGALVLAILMVPALGSHAARIARGAYVLVIDFQSVPLPGWGLTIADDGTIRAWGLVKKSLLDSLPYAAAILLLAPRLLAGPGRAEMALCLLFALPFVAFFAMNTWHGGGNNMRYFLNFVPVVAILSASALREISTRASAHSWPALAALLAVILAAVGYAGWRGYPAVFLVQHTLPMSIALGLAGLSVAVLAAPERLRGMAARAALGLFMLGLATAGAVGWGLDLMASEQTRARNAAITALAEDLPPDALVVTEAPEASAFRVNRPPALTAHFDFRAREIGRPLADLVVQAFREGRPVFVQGRHVAERFLDAGHAEKTEPVYGLPEHFEFYRLTPPDGAGEAR